MVTARKPVLKWCRNSPRLGAVELAERNEAGIDLD